MDKPLHIAELVAKKIRGIITPGEQQELDNWINESPENQELFDRVADPKKQLDKLEIYRLFNKEKVRTNLEEELFGTKTVRFAPPKVLRYAAAILLPVLVAGGFAYWFLRAPSTGTLAEIDNVIKPGSQKAVLYLSDGTTLELDPETSVAALKEGGASITNEKMHLSYTSQGAESLAGVLIFNELRTPHGGGYNLKLDDGTEVWLNSGSSIKFPVSFQDSVRQVFLNGEAYFEVSHNDKPFIVSTANMNTRVLGTSFNVSAYSDDPEFKTTLIEGKVRIELMADDASISASTLLAPNEQATLIRSGSEISTTPVNASGYISWMQGKMEFHNETLEIVMKRLSRWYDFEYSFENVEAREFHFSARLDKEESISSILKMLEMTTDVRFEYRGNSIVVL